MRKLPRHPQFRKDFRGNHNINIEEMSYKQLHFMMERFYECREKTLEDLRILGKQYHCELEGWLTPIEREFILNECIRRGVESDEKNESAYKKALGWGKNN